VNAPFDSLRSLRAEPSMNSAETVYLFRHALLRDAAYQLQLPGDRARLHGLAFAVIEALCGGRAPEPPSLENRSVREIPPWAGDGSAFELAEQARLAAEGGDGGEFPALRILYLRRAAEYAQRHFQAEDALRCWRALAGLAAGAARGEALRRAGILAHQSGQAREGEQLLFQALVAQRDARNPSGEGDVLGDLAVLYRQTGRIEQAGRELERALALQRESGYRHGEAIILGNMGLLNMETGRMDLAREQFELALPLLLACGDRRSAGLVLSNIGILWQETGRPEEAARTFEEALAVHREVGDLRGEGMSLASLASVHETLGRHDESVRTNARALEIHRQVGNRRGEGVVLGNGAGKLLNEGRLAEACSGFVQALAIHREVGNRRFEGIHLGGYARCLLALGRTREAEEAGRGGCEILAALKDPRADELKTSLRDACAKAGVPAFEGTEECE